MKYLMLLTILLTSCDNVLVNEVEKTKLTVYYGQKSTMTYFSNRDYVFYEISKEISKVPEWFELKNDSTYKIFHIDFLTNDVDNDIFVDYEEFKLIIKRSNK